MEPIDCKFDAKDFTPPRIKGIENIPEKEPLIFVVNHPSFYDQFIIEQCSPREMFIYGENLFKNDLPQKIKDFLLFHNNTTMEQAPKDFLEDANEKLKQSKTIAIFPENQKTRDGIKMNSWSDNINYLIESNPDVKIVPVVIKDIKQHYRFKYNENGEITKTIPLHYFKPIEIEFGRPLSLKSEDVSKLQRLIEKMGKERI